MCLRQHDAGLLISASNNLQLGMTTGLVYTLTIEFALISTGGCCRIPGTPRLTLRTVLTLRIVCVCKFRRLCLDVDSVSTNDTGSWP